MKNILNYIKDILGKSKDVGLVTGADIIGSAISAIFYFTLAGIMDTESYGKIGYFLAIATVISVISRVGATNTIMIYAAKQVKIQSSVFFVSMIISVIASTIYYFIFHDFGVSIIIIGYVIFALATSDALGQKLFKVYSKYIITQKLLMIGFAIGLYYWIGFDGVILGIALSFIPYSLRIYKVFKEMKIDFSLLKERFGFIINSYVLDLSGTFIGSIDKIIIAPMFGFMILGNYHLAIQFLAILYIIPNAVYKYTLPHDASGLTNFKTKKVGLFVAIILSLLGIFVSPFVLPVLFPNFGEATSILQIISFAVIPNYIGLMFISKYLGLEKIKIVIIGSGIYLTIQIVSIIVLGQMYGVNGIAASIVIAESIQCIYFLAIGKVIRHN